MRTHLTQVEHRTYLWLYLILRVIEDDLIARNEDTIAKAIATISATLEEAYSEILNKSDKKGEARKLLHIVLSADRPLSLREVNIAMVIDVQCYFESDLEPELWQENECQSIVKNICGLFLRVVDDKVYLIHQTAREYLVAAQTSDNIIHCQGNSVGAWKNTFHATESNFVLAKACVLYIMLNDTPSLSELSNRPSETFLWYAAERWHRHFGKAGTRPDKALLEKVAFRLCNPQSLDWEKWTSFEAVKGFNPFKLDGTALIGASFLGQDAVVKLLLDKGGAEGDIKARDRLYGDTELIYTSFNGHVNMIKLLLHAGAEVDAQAHRGETGLLWAASQGHKGIADLLVKANADIHLRDAKGSTPFAKAAANSCTPIMMLLLDVGAKVNAQNNNGETALLQAARSWERPWYEAIG